MRSTFLALAALAASLTAAAAQADDAADADPIGQVMIHPVFAGDYACSQHWEGQLPYKGDALGADCFRFASPETADGAAFPRTFRTDGRTNADWYSWREPVLAPFDGEVVRVTENPVVNTPGELGEPPASLIVFERADGVRALYAHVAEIAVVEGDRVAAGEPVAVVGNNGFSRSPHVHVGAWRDDEPLQIRFDLRAMGALRSAEEG